MSLRVRELTGFTIACDTCKAEAPLCLRPVEAETKAAEAGWHAGTNPLTHKCPKCVEKS